MKQAPSPVLLQKTKFLFSQIREIDVSKHIKSHTTLPQTDKLKLPASKLDIKPLADMQKLPSLRQVSAVPALIQVPEKQVAKSGGLLEFEKVLENYKLEARQKD